MDIRTFGLWIVLCVTAIGAARADEIDDYVTEQMSRQRIPGLSLAVVKGGKAVKVKGYGLANLELGTRATPKSVYQIGSISKQFIATGIVLLSSEGKLGLDDSLRKYFDDAPETWRAMTVRHVLSHTSGLVRETPGLQVKEQSEMDVIRAAYGVPLAFEPGEKWSYSNLGYFVLAEIISRTAHMPWPRYLQERIFSPLQMNATRTTTVEERVAHRASGYQWMDTNEYRNAPDLPGVRPSGAFLSSVLDLIKWDAALYSDKVLSSQQRELMWTPVKLNDGSEKPYGLGWEVGRLGQHRQVKHAGTMLGFRAQMLRLIDDRLTVIVLANATQALPEKIASGVAAFYLPDLQNAQPKRVAEKLSAEVLEGYAGKYQLSAERSLTVARSEGRLTVAMPLVSPGLDEEMRALVRGVSMQIALLTPESETRFFDEEDPRSTYVFSRDAQGRVQLELENAEGKVVQKASRIDSPN